MVKKVEKYKLLEGEYSSDFIKLLAMAVHLNLIKPSELLVLQQDGIAIDQISSLLTKRILDNRKTNFGY